MAIRRLILALSCLTSISACASNTQPFKEADEKTLFKNFALAHCAGMAYAGESERIRADVSVALSGYREFGNIALEAYEKVRNLTELWLAKDYPSKQGEQIQIMKCIDLYNADALDAIFDEFDPCKTPEAWLDQEEYNMRCSHSMAK